MFVEGTVPLHIVSENIAAASETEAARQFQEKYPNARIEKIDGRFVLGICADCGSPVFEGDSGYVYAPDDKQYTCLACNCQE